MRFARRSTRVGTLILLSIAVLLLAPNTTSSVVASSFGSNHGGVITIYSNSTIERPVGIAVGSDGALWFANVNNSIGRITTGGVISNFTDPSMSDPYSITEGSDGALWFTNLNTGCIGRITVAGDVSSFCGPDINAWWITTGPDGNLWFTNIYNNSIGRMTTNGVVTIFTDPSIDYPAVITAGPDGALWFTNNANGSIGRITTGGVVTNYASPRINTPWGITTGPDGALWFTNHNSVGRITTSGQISIFPVPNTSGGITTGSDGALWFTQDGHYIGRVTTSGVATDYRSKEVGGPEGIVAGPDGALWFTDAGGNTIGRISAVPAMSVSPATGPSETPVTVSGESYAPGEEVDVTYKTGLSSPSSRNLCTAAASADGTFTCSGSIPAKHPGALGSHNIVAKGVVSLARANVVFDLT